VTLVALTGGLATGKSFVGHALGDLGCHLIQADELGHQVLARDGEAYSEVVAQFGQGILDSDGSINRRLLGTMVFDNPERLRALTDIVHPKVRQREREIISQIASTDPGAIVVVEAAIHIETGGYRNYDQLILVVCSEEQQIERAMKRDNLSRAEVEARLRRQMPLSEKRKYADYVIDTSGEKEETIAQVGQVYNRIKSNKHV
jgi:dephospho-CoA kinase